MLLDLNHVGDFTVGRASDGSLVISDGLGATYAVDPALRPTIELTGLQRLVLPSNLVADFAAAQVEVTGLGTLHVTDFGAEAIDLSQLQVGLDTRKTLEFAAVAGAFEAQAAERVMSNQAELYWDAALGFQPNITDVEYDALREAYGLSIREFYSVVGDRVAQEFSQGNRIWP